MWDEHEINQAYEEHLERAWEEYNEEGDTDEEDYDVFAEGEARWESYERR